MAAGVEGLEPGPPAGSIRIRFESGCSLLTPDGRLPSLGLSVSVSQIVRQGRPGPLQPFSEGCEPAFCLRSLNCSAALAAGL